MTVIGIVAALLGLVSAAPALAHDQLVGSSPGDGEVLQRPPREVALTFTSDVLPIGPTVLVRDAAGRSVQDGEPAVEGSVVTTSLPTDLADGAYVVVWRVVSGDGHPIEGALTFTVGVRQDDAGPTTAVPASAANGPGPVVFGAAVAAGVVTLGLILLLRRRSRP